MEKKVISCPDAPAAVGTYSQAIIAGDTIYVSGQLPIVPATGAFPEGGVKEQMEQVFTNLKNILNYAGYDFCDVVKTTVYLADIADFGVLNEVYAKYFSAPYPARAAYQVVALPKGARIEAEVIAVK